MFLDITDSELMVFKCIMEAGEPITVIDIIERIKAQYGKEWKRSTVCTFISHLIDKGYVEMHKKGVHYYYISLLEPDDFRRIVGKDFLDFWFHGSLTEMLQALKSES